MADALSKAFQINQDAARYGAFAEIGAGQEVARYFFQAGKASQTIAKTISAYDMIVSDEIYGREKNGRYVCESRLDKMLTHEYSLLVERLQKKRGDVTNFFAFANTVATAAPDSGKQSHGWMGVRFQTRPGGEQNEIILHVRMQDRYRLQQQDALGILGVNLIHNACYGLQDMDSFIPHLVEGLKKKQVVIDVMKFKGPDVAHFDTRLMNLELVRRGMAEAILFSPKKEILNISDEVYGKSLLIQRGNFNPVTKTHLDVMEKGLTQLQQDVLKIEGNAAPILSMMELTMPQLQNAGHLDEKDFLARVEVLTALGHYVLISNFEYFYTLKRFMRRYTSHTMALVMSAGKLEKVFTEDYYRNLEGRLLEGLGKLLGKKTKLYIYPHKTDKICLTAKSFFPAPNLHHIYQYFIENGRIVDISGCDEAAEYVHSNDVMQLMKAGDKKWETLVPEKARDLIRKLY